MNRLSLLLVAVLCFVISNQTSAANPDPKPQDIPEPFDMYTAWQVVWMQDQEKLARDISLSLNDIWNEPLFVNVAGSEQQHMDELQAQIDLYGLNEWALVKTDEIGVFGDDRHTTAFNELTDRGKDSLLEAYRAAAYVEEWDIQELNGGLVYTPVEPLCVVYTNLLASACNHLQIFSSHISDLGFSYEAQLLTLSEQEAICGSVESTVCGLNSGFNDAWYSPQTSGQGFFITVFPELNTVSLAWFTYDTEFPPPDATANLGDPGHRWLTAVGPIEGQQALLNIEMTSGGLFDTPSEIQRTDPPGSDGTILLTFTSCNSGTVQYYIPSIDRHGTVEIQRVADDNIALCEALNSNVD